MGFEQFDTVLAFAGLMLLLSLQITILVQTIVATFGLRGRNLLWGVEELLRRMNPSFTTGDLAQKLASAVLQHPALAHTRSIGGRRMATAIRPQELLRVLDDLQRNPPPGLDETVKRTLTTFLQNTTTGESPEMAEKAATIVKDLSRLFPAETQAIQDVVTRAIALKRQVEVQVGAWFTTVMDRTTERFILWNRWITIAVAFPLAIGLQVDSVQIFRQLSTDSTVRARLVAGVDTLLTEGERITTDQKSPRPLATAAIKTVAQNLKDTTEGKTLASAQLPPDLVARKQGIDWLSQQFSAGESREKVLAAYDAAFTEGTKAYLKELGATSDRLTALGEQTGLRILWLYPSATAGEHARRNYWVGVFITGLFLSLGAPFWYNVLRQLTSLRPLIAGKVEKETAEKKTS